ncbi:hypothetical protein Ciccas_001194 [Cichlidogyrus casuarinus]|uniref:RRM domain-containing protein n=1 Tax=Cichlidogyrus casuarinus TaxID=1844966 RepID=A0ABD2QL81_9PLAT
MSLSACDYATYPARGSLESDKTSTLAQSNELTNASKNNAGDENLRKIFVGGLSPGISARKLLNCLFYIKLKDELRNYFRDFGEIESCIIKFSKDALAPRGFGFIVFKDDDSVKKVLEVPNHQIGHLRIEPKLAKPAREETRKIFIGTVDPALTIKQITDHFKKFGTIISVDLPIDTSSGRRKPFGFVLFSRVEHAKKAAATEKQNICGTSIILIGGGYQNVNPYSPQASSLQSAIDPNTLNNQQNYFELLNRFAMLYNYQSMQVCTQQVESSMDNESQRTEEPNQGIQFAVNQPCYIPFYINAMRPPPGQQIPYVIPTGAPIMAFNPLNNLVMYSNQLAEAHQE